MQLLHITDLHIVSTEGEEIYGSDSTTSLRAVLAAALVLPEPPAAIVVTGDLAERGDVASYARLRQLLLETGLPVYLLPGNHDSRAAMQSALIGGPIQADPVIDLGEWRIVLLDSKVPHRSHGFLDPGQLERLTAALDEAPERPVLACLHHGPARYCASSGCQLYNADELLQLLASHTNARGVLSGHGHVDIERSHKHTKLFVTPSTCSQLWHAQPGEVADPEDFATSHKFDPSRYGFRMLVLGADGSIESRVHWVPQI